MKRFGLARNYQARRFATLRRDLTWMIVLLSAGEWTSATAQEITRVDATTSPATPLPPDGAVGGMGDINLYPKRIVLSERERTASIGLYNRALVEGEYEISIGDMVMRPGGQMVPLSAISDPAERERVKPASAWLKWSPHRINLPASEALMVRIMARIPPDLPQGEYRAHFSVVSVPLEAAPATIEQATGEAGGNNLAVRIRPRFGITVPVILRIGVTTLSTALSDLDLITLSDGRQGLRVKITRTGTRSAFGDIVVTAPGAKKPVAEMKGVGVYPEIDSRTVVIPFDVRDAAATPARGTRLTISYTDDDFTPGQILAKQDFMVP